MIIKSMARKEPSFGQLIEYMSDIVKSDEQYHVYQNVFARQQEGLEQEFRSNAAFVPKRKNGNYLYHEILSISKAEKLDAGEQKKILRSIAQEYAKRRAGTNLVFGALHDDHDDHLHYHLCISANALGESKKTRLSKAQFDKLKKQLESEVLTQYPQLEQKVVINKEAGEKLSRKGSERKRRTGETPQRDSVKEKLTAIFQGSRDKPAFFIALSDAGFEFYARGKTLGVKDLATGRKHRLKTLGLLEAFEALTDRIELTEEKPVKKDGTQASKDQEQSAAREAAPEKPKPTPEAQTKQEKPEAADSVKKTQAKKSAEEERLTKRKAEMEELRRKQKTSDQQSRKDKQ